MCVTGISRAEVRNVSKHLTMSRTALTIKNHPANSAMSIVPRLRHLELVPHPDPPSTVPSVIVLSPKYLLNPFSIPLYYYSRAGQHYLLPGLLKVFQSYPVSSL